MRKSLLFAAFISVIAFLSSFLARAVAENMMVGGEEMKDFVIGPMGWLGWGSGMLFMISFWVLALIGIVILVKWLVGQNKIKYGDKSALDILKERYARGEISKEEFEGKKKELS
jgi:putative membrane protein